MKIMKNWQYMNFWFRAERVLKLKFISHGVRINFSCLHPFSNSPVDFLFPLESSVPAIYKTSNSRLKENGLKLSSFGDWQENISPISLKISQNGLFNIIEIVECVANATFDLTHFVTDTNARVATVWKKVWKSLISVCVIIPIQIIAGG